MGRARTWAAKHGLWLRKRLLRSAAESGERRKKAAETDCAQRSARRETAGGQGWGGREGTCCVCWKKRWTGMYSTVCTVQYVALGMAGLSTAGE